MSSRWDPVNLNGTARDEDVVGAIDGWLAYQTRHEITSNFEAVRAKMDENRLSTDEHDLWWLEDHESREGVSPMRSSTFTTELPSPDSSISSTHSPEPDFGGVHTPRLTIKPIVRSRDGCACGQEQKVVVFVGCTQNGKSSMIRSILRYAGSNDNAALVAVGMGNESTTKEVSSYDVIINIRKHELIDSDGASVIVDQNTELYDFEPRTTASAQHIHLRMIDTPGLDDSDNIEEDSRRAANQGSDHQTQMKTIDEAHKLAVLKELASQKEVHAVCFVLSLENTLGNATQELTRQYLDIFRQSKLDATFHFAHTYVNIENMFETKAVQRPDIIETTFYLSPGQARHHLIDNLPLEDDSISQHFAELALANFLSALAYGKGQSTSRIAYPKSSAHITMDHDLRQSFQALNLLFTGKISELQAELNDLEKNKHPLVKKRKVQHEDWQAAIKRVESIDTEEYVQIDYASGYDRSHLFSSAALLFNFDTKFPIRKYERSPTYSVEWSGPYTWMIGTKSCHATAKAEYGEPLTASMTLYGWKKEVQAADLERAIEERVEAKEDHDETTSKLEEIQENIIEVTTALKHLRTEISNMKEVQGFLKETTIDIQKLWSKSSYFMVPNTICYGYGQNLDMKTVQAAVHVDWESIPVRDLQVEYQDEREKYRSLMSVCTVTLDALAADIDRKIKIKNKLNALKAEAKSFTVSNKDYRPNTDIRELSVPLQFEAASHWESFHRQLQQRCTDSMAQISQWNEEMTHVSSEQLKFLDRGLKAVEGEERAARAVHTRWQNLKESHEASLAAIEQVQNILKADLISLAGFTILRKGFEEHGVQSHIPWSNLFSEIREAYRCSPDTFAKIEFT